MGQVEGRTGIFQSGIIVVEQRLGAGLGIARGVGERLAKRVAELHLKTAARAFRDLGLETVIGGVAPVHQVVSALNVLVGIEVDASVGLGRHVLVGEFADLPLLQIGLIRGAGQVAAV